MSHTTREPSTKFYGPNYPFVQAANPNHWLVHLHNLKPGDTWNPAWAAELLAPMTFVPLATPAIWLWPGVFSWGTWRFHPGSMLLIVRERATRTYVFEMKLDFCVTRWGTNDRTDPTGNFAYDGTAEVIFRKA